MPPLVDSVMEQRREATTEGILNGEISSIGLSKIVVKTIICFGDDWGRHPSTLQFLARCLAQRYRIIWVDSLGLRRPLPTIRDCRRVLNKLIKWWAGPSSRIEARRGVVVLTPLVLPFHLSRVARAINRLILQRTLRRLTTDSAMQGILVVVTMFPYTEYLLGHLGEQTSVYYCADELSDFPGMNPSVVREMERRLLQKVDSVVVTSEALLEAKRAMGKPISLLRHGVDIEHFAPSKVEQISVPVQLRAVPHPCFGYHGLLQDIIDFDLITAVAQRRTDWSFVFIGAAYGEVGNLPVLPNIHYLPAQPYSEIPMFVAQFDVCLIPYRLTERTTNCNPIKLREYLAAGKPVLSTHLPEVMLYKDVVAFVRTPEEFIAQGERLLKATEPKDVKQRMERVGAESWEAVASRFAMLLEQSNRQTVVDGECQSNG